MIYYTYEAMLGMVHVLSQIFSCELNILYLVNMKNYVYNVAEFQEYESQKLSWQQVLDVMSY